MAMSPEEKRTYRRNYYLRNREKQLSDAKDRYAKSDKYVSEERKRVLAARAAAWRERNPEKVAAYQLKYKKRAKALYAANREERIIQQRERYKREKHKWLEYRRRKNYNVSPERQAKLLSAQNGCCPICGIHYTKAKLAFLVDHDHTCCPGDYSCGKCVRGLLCRPCNVGIGNLKDNVENLRRAIAYLRNPTTRKSESNGKRRKSVSRTA